MTGDTETTTFDVEVTEQLLELAMRVKPDDQSLEQYAADAVAQKVTLDSYENHTYEAVVEVPEEAVELGELRAEDAAFRRGEDVNPMDIILEHVDFDFQMPDVSERSDK